MDPFSLIALATAAGFVFKKMSGSESGQTDRTRFILPRRSKIVPGTLHTTGVGIDIDEIEELPEYRFVKKLIDTKYPLVFVTGGAGTGKSTLINWLMHYYPGDVLLAAPTAISAANIDGKTLHSLFQLPLEWITPQGIKSAPHRTDIRNAKLLIIDEISMVNANILDGVSTFLRKNREVDKPFGGLPVVMVGDLFQLPPVIKSGVEDLFKQFYQGQSKFYGASALTESDIVYYAVELSKTFRQTDKKFVEVLADIREGTNLEEALRVINDGCSITQSPPPGSVWLAPRRTEVDRANREGLQRLSGRLYRFEGRMEGNFCYYQGNLPSPKTLELRVGAQVMFTRNDPQKRWVNGTVGTVIGLGNTIQVQTQPSGKVVEVAKARWVNFQYRWNEKTGEIEKEELGSYHQFPLIHAWATTIHKSQGKTIEKVHLDLGRGAFAFGQTYVALSRCRELGGLSLSRKLTAADIKVDRDSQVFNGHLHDLMERLPPEQMLAALQKCEPEPEINLDLDGRLCPQPEG